MEESIEDKRYAYIVDVSKAVSDRIGYSWQSIYGDISPYWMPFESVEEEVQYWTESYLYTFREKRKMLP